VHNCTFFLRKHKCTFFSWENKIAIVIHSVLSSTHNCTFFWVLHIQLSHSLAKKRFDIKNRELFCILKSKMLLYYFPISITISLIFGEYHYAIRLYVVQQIFHMLSVVKWIFWQSRFSSHQGLWGFTFFCMCHVHLPPVYLCYWNLSTLNVSCISVRP
jgi:hypothetical protein